MNPLMTLVNKKKLPVSVSNMVNTAGSNTLARYVDVISVPINWSLPVEDGSSVVQWDPTDLAHTHFSYISS